MTVSHFFRELMVVGVVILRMPFSDQIFVSHQYNPHHDSIRVFISLLIDPILREKNRSFLGAPVTQGFN